MYFFGLFLLVLKIIGKNPICFCKLVGDLIWYGINKLVIKSFKPDLCVGLLWIKEFWSSRAPAVLAKK
jgi:hypothetical protein